MKKERVEATSRKDIVVITLLTVFTFIGGVIYACVSNKVSKKCRNITIGVFVALCIFYLSIGGSETPTTNQVSTNTVTSDSNTESEETKEVVTEPVEETKTEAPVVEEAVKEDQPTETLEQKNAVAKAKSYLNYTSFSRTGLIEQLEYEGFSTEASTYAVDKCNVDWSKQAELKAKSYLDYTSFSRDGLLEQLEFEGFTPEEAEHGVTSVGY